MTAKLRNKRGFTLVELMIVVAIVGVLAALAIYGVQKYVASSKTTEARTSIGRIAKDAKIAYNREKSVAGVLADDATADTSNSLCESAAAIPAAVPKKQKYQTKAADWNGAGWSCLKFSMTEPQYYQYQYTSDLTAGTFSATAKGNLDGDADESTFVLAGEVRAGEVVIAPSVEETNPEE